MNHSKIQWKWFGKVLTKWHSIFNSLADLVPLDTTFCLSIFQVGLHITRLKKSSSASSKSLIDMLPKKSDLVKSPSSSPPKSPTLKLNCVKSPSNFSPISTFFNKKRKEETRFFFPDDDDDDDVFSDEKYGCSPSEKKVRWW